MMKQSIIFFTMFAFSMARYTPYEYRCEPVTAKMCRDLDPENYVFTSFPNFMNHSSSEIANKALEAANKELANYIPGMNSGCSKILKMLLCTLFVPICKPGVATRVPPCQSLCKAARNKCEPLFNSAQIKWPNSMECARFPDANSGELCLDLPDSQPTAEPEEEKNDEDIIHALNQIPSKRTFVKKGNTAPAIVKKELNAMQEVELVCNSDKQIHVRKVRHWSDSGVGCCSADTLELMSEKCNGKQQCTVILDKDVIGTSCVASMKKTSVKYKCVSKERIVSYKKSHGCGKKNKNRI